MPEFKTIYYLLNSLTDYVSQFCVISHLKQLAFVVNLSTNFTIIGLVITMKWIIMKRLLLTIYLGLLLFVYSVQAQPAVAQQSFDYYELKGLLLKHKATMESMLAMKRFTLASKKEKPESTIYGYKKEGDAAQILIRVRKSDGLVREIGWSEVSSTLGNLTHDAVYDGFVPVAGNSQYYNRFQKMALLVNYKLAEEETVPCVLRLTE